MNALRTTTWRATVAVRIPSRDDGDLAACARRRIERRPTVETAEVHEIRDLEPALSATVVTVAVTVHLADDREDAAVRTSLEAAPGVQRVEAVRTE